MTGAVAAAWSAAEASHHADWARGLISFPEQRRRRLRDVLPMVGLPVGDEAALDATFAEHLQCYQGAWRGFDDVDAALALLRARGLVTAVLTNGAEAQQRAKLERVGVLHAVGPVFTAEALGVAKPSRQAFATVCTSLALAPGAVLHVGDDEALDVTAARDAGLHAVHLDRTGGAAGEDATVTTLAALGDHLERLEQQGSAPEAAQPATKMQNGWPAGSA